MLALGVVIRLTDQFSGPLGEAIKRTENLSKTANKLIGLGVGMNVAALATSGLSASMRGNLMGLADSVIALDDAAAKIRSMPGVSEEAVQRMVVAGRMWSQAHTDTAEEYVDTSYMMLSAGLNEVQALAATAKALAIAKATMGNGQETADLLAISYNNMGDKSRDAGQEIGRMGDILTKTQQIFQIKNMAQLGDGVKYATAAALQARMPFNDLLATIGQLNNAGLQGSMAGTALMATLRELPEAAGKLDFKVAYDPAGNLDFVKTLENVKAKFGDIGKLTLDEQVKLQKAFGSEGARALVLLARNMDEYRKNIDSVNDSLGATDEAQKKMESGAGQQMKIAMNNWMEFKRIFGTEILPVLKELLPTFKALIIAAGGFAKENPGLVKFALAAAVFGAVLSPLLSGLGSLLTITGILIKFWPLLAVHLGKVGVALQFLRVAAMAHPIGLLIALIAGGALWVIQNWDKVKTWFADFMTWIDPLIQKLSDMMPGWMKGDGPAVKAMAAPALGPARPGAGASGQARVGGDIRVRVDQDGRVAGVTARADNRDVPFSVDGGMMMVSP